MKEKLLTLLVALFSVGSMSAQTSSPGGVTSPELWFKTVAETSNLQGRYSWTDFSGDSVKLRLYDSRGPLYGTEYSLARTQVRNYNFNPAMDLSEIYASKQFLINKTNLSQSTIISVWGGDYGAFDQDMFLYALNGRAGSGYIFTKDKLIHSKESGEAIFDYGNAHGNDLNYQPSDPESNINKFRERSLRIASYNRALQPNNSVWGEKDKAVISIGEIFHPLYPINTSTFNMSDLNNRAFFGYTPEFIIYNRILSPLERRKAESYLAIKYGLTLDMSYIGSKDQLLWDLSENEGYNTRVTAYGRDDASGMYQKRSSTSYEEAPYYSEAYGNLYDSFDLNNSYNLPSRYRLLVMGRQNASSIQDGNYVLFGDNDQDLKVSAEGGAKGMQLMQRHWLLNTNIKPTSAQSKKLDWHIEGLDFYTQDFKSIVTKQGTSGDLFGSLVTQSPLVDQDGYFSWTTTSTRRGPVSVKFGTNNPELTEGSHDYGYVIESSGLVFKIEKGKRLAGAIATVYINQKIEIGKEGSTIYLRSNGIRLHTYDINIAAEDINKTYYGSILISKHNQEDIILSELRHGGFVDTGNQVELSYIVQRANEFLNYRKDGRSYLVIDRSGTGDFSSDEVEYIASDELDESRYKIIFNNIFWDIDGNGKDMFTFGYRENNLVAVVSPEDPTCKDDILQKNGQIDIHIKQGFKGFSYLLTDVSSKEEQKGIFFEDFFTIKDLAAGSYDLTLSEMGGFNLYPKQLGEHSNQAIGSIYFNSVTNAYAEWTVSENTEASVGMKLSATLIRKAGDLLIDYGLAVNEGKLYQVDKGVVGTSSLGTIVPGDRLRVERVAYKILYKLNEEEIGSLDIRKEDRLTYNYPVVDVARGGIYNLTFNRIATTASWLTTHNLAMEKSLGDQIVETINLVANCDGAVIIEEEKPEKSERLTIYRKNPGNGLELTVKLELEQPEAVTVLVFALNGSLVSKVNLDATSTSPELDINLPTAGVYIIKTITHTQEYTRKILAD